MSQGSPLASGGMPAGPRIGDLVGDVATILQASNVAEPRAEARDIVAAVSGQRRFWPRLHSETAAADGVIELALTVARRRAEGMPFAYAVGRAAFRYLTLRVDERVLIPRQETEQLVELVLREQGGMAHGVVADVGTGSGAIALALASEGNFDRVIGTDIATDAIELARENAQATRSAAMAPVEFRCGDLLAPLRRERFDVIVSNPPYIAYDEVDQLPASVRNWEPAYALLCGGGGLEATRRLARDAAPLLSRGGLLALEVDSRRALQVAELLASGGSYEAIRVHGDLTGRDRFVTARRT